MGFRTILTLAIFFSACFGVAGWPEPRASQPSSGTYRAATGWICFREDFAVGADSFSVMCSKIRSLWV
jgi:hypothetical protein